jgi:hypothetical protein
MLPGIESNNSAILTHPKIAYSNQNSKLFNFLPYDVPEGLIHFSSFLKNY